MTEALTGLNDPEVREAAEELVLKDGNGDSAPLRDGYRRYYTLTPFELRAVRGRLMQLAHRAGGIKKINEGEQEAGVEELGVTTVVHQTVAHHTFKAYATACSHFLDWSEYDWNWPYILEDAEEIRGHAERVVAALKAVPEESGCTAVFARAVWYATYDAERHEEIWQQYKVDEWIRSETQAKIETIPDARDDLENVEHRKARRVYERAGWSGAREGGREELEALTDAILWTRKS